MPINSIEHLVVNNALTEALFRLMCEKPFADITITELTRKAGTSRATFYRNFESKEDVIAGFITRMITDFHRTYGIEKISDRFVHEYAGYLLEHIRKYNPFLHLIYDSGLSSVYLDCLNRYVLRLHSEEIVSEKEYYLLVGYAGAEFNMIFSGVIARERSREIGPDEISLMFETSSPE